MSVSTLEIIERNMAEVLRHLGNIDPARIRLPVGVATEQDVVDALEAADKRLYELIDGVLVEKIMGFRESVIGNRVVHHLWSYLDENDRGIAFSADGAIRIRVGRIRFPDAGFISWDRLPGEELPDDPICDAIPDLAIEVISKGNTVEEMALKLKDYFEAGVRLVWLIYPKTQTVLAHASPTSKRTFTKDDVLDAGKVLPGFKVPVKSLFTRSRKRANGKR